MTPCPGTCPACLSLYGVVATLFRLRDNWRIGFEDHLVPLADDSPCDEGVCIRIESGMIPEIYKLKSPIFLQHETAMLDKDVVDIDADETASVEDATTGVNDA